MKCPLSAHSRQEFCDMWQNQITAEEGVGMTETGQREEGGIRHGADTLPVLLTDRIILACKQQARHGHLYQDFGEAWTLKGLGTQGDERLRIILEQPGSERWRYRSAGCATGSVRLSALWRHPGLPVARSAITRLHHSLRGEMSASGQPRRPSSDI